MESGELPRGLGVRLRIQPLVTALRIECEARRLRLGHHPLQGVVGDRAVTEASADVGVGAEEPDLLDRLVLQGGGSPDCGLERAAHLIERQRVAGDLHIGR